MQTGVSTGATFGMTKLIVTFRNFANAPQNDPHILCPVQFFCTHYGF
jgi:hypothetical protein